MILNTLIDIVRPRHRRQREIRIEWRRRETSSVRLADLLEESFRMRDHAHAGWGRFDDDAEQEFGVPPRQAWTFLHLGQRLRRLPKTRRALLTGTLGYTKAREFASIATPEDEAEWIEYAVRHSSRALERKVRQARVGAGDEKEHFSAWYDGFDVQVIEQAWHEAKREVGATMALADLLPFLARRYLEGKLPRGRRKLMGFTVVQACPNCLDTWIPTRTGNLKVAFERFVERVRDPEAKHVNLLGEQLCGCDGPKHRADRCPEDPASEIYRPKLAVSRYVGKEVLYRVWLRDAGRCRVPGCTTSGEPENSHLRPVRAGGPAEAYNLVTMCGHCNDLYEAGRMEIRGEAPFETYWREGNCFGIGFEAEVRRAEPALSHGGQPAPEGEEALAGVG